MDELINADRKIIRLPHSKTKPLSSFLKDKIDITIDTGRAKLGKNAVKRL